MSFTHTDTLTPETQEFFLDNPDPKIQALFKPWMKDIRLKQIQSVDELEEVLERAREVGHLAWDVETRSLRATLDNVVGHCLAYDEFTGYYIPVGHRIPEDLETDPNLDPQVVWEMLMETFKHPGLNVYVYNLKFEGRVLRSADIHTPSYDLESQQIKIHDGFIYRWLYNPDSRFLDLKSSVQLYLNRDMLVIKEVPGVVQKIKSKTSIDFGGSDPRLATVYAAADPVFTLSLVNFFKNAEDRRFDPGVPGTLYPILVLEHRIVDALFVMERPLEGTRPLRIDRDFLRYADQDLTDWLKLVMFQIFKEANTSEININSPAQVAGMLTRLADIKFTLSDTGNPVTNEKALKQIASRDVDEELDERVRRAARISAKILTHRSYTKQRSTYVRSLLNSTEDEPYVRLLFRSVGVKTGRFAGGKPERGDAWYTPFNAQNVPNAAKFKSHPCRKIKNPQVLIGTADDPGLVDYLLTVQTPLED